MIYEAFRQANNGRPLFDLQPMTFKKSGSDEPVAAWRTYFAGLEWRFQKAALGSTPAASRRSPVLTDALYGTVTRKPAAPGSVGPVEKQR